MVDQVTETAQNNTESGEGEATQQTETVQATETQAEGKTVLTTGEQAKTLEVAPESYADFSVPEGIELNSDMLSKFSTIAKEVNLSQDNAQKLVDLVSDNTKSLIEKEAEAFDKVREDWIDSLKKDPDFGGEKFNETVERAKRTVNKFGSPDLLKFLDESGYGDNTELLKLFARVDRLVGEDKTVDGKPSGQSTKTLAETIYPNQGK